MTGGGEYNDEFGYADLGSNQGEQPVVFLQYVPCYSFHISFQTEKNAGQY
jgi:hypothetical protein